MLGLQFLDLAVADPVLAGDSAAVIDDPVEEFVEGAVGVGAGVVLWILEGDGAATASRSAAGGQGLGATLRF